MTGRHTRRWFAAIPITGRFYIMFAILVLCEGGVLFGALRAMELQSEASTDLARVAAVQRSLDRALTIHTSIATDSQSAATPPGAGEQNLLNALRAQLDLTWALEATRKSPASPTVCGSRPRNISKAPKRICARTPAAQPPGRSPILSRGVRRSKPRYATR